MTTKLTFHGAAGTVTGSRHLLETDARKILVDCGLFQGLKALRLKNWEPTPFDPRSVDHLVLTHTHIDHAGYLPRLVKEGFRGPVWATRATCELAGILLRDSARIQMEDAEHANRKKWSKHDPALPLYTEEDAERALTLFRPVRYGEWIDLGEGARARFSNAGHILGSAHVEVRVEDGGREKTVVFSGDVGRYDAVLHPDPSARPECDVLVVESTYGKRVHDDVPVLDQLRGPVRKTLERGGTVLVPAFAVGRSQLVTLILGEAMEAGEIPAVPIHIDSPMAVDATEVYRKYLDEANLDARVVEDGKLFPRHVSLHRTVDESKALNALPGPRIIISASGMLVGGRVLHHLKRLVGDGKNLLCLVGYQAPGTRGRALLDGADRLKMHGRKIPVECGFVNVHGLSAHADRDGLVRWATSGESAPEEIFCVHGEPDAAAALAERLRQETGARTHAPGLDDSFEI